MLTPEQVAGLQVAFEQLADPLNEYIVQDVARRVSEAGQLTSTAQYMIWRGQQLGMSQRQLKAYLRKYLNVSHREIRRLLTQSAEVGYDFDIKHLPYVQAVKFRDNVVMQQIVAAAVELATESFTNIVQTTAIGFTAPDGHFYPMTEAYYKTTDFAFSQVATGVTDYNTAVRQACAKLTAGGVKAIDYASGVHTTLEAAVRRNIMGGLGLMQEQISKQNHDDLGCDGWEITAHAASAPDHEPIQGKQYSDAEYEALNNSLVRRIGTLNCGHAAYPIILGVNSPQYTREELEQFRTDNAKGVDYEGRHFKSVYEATQYQRQIERAIRAQKRRVLAANATPDKERQTQTKARLTALNAEYVKFSKAVGLRTQEERLFVSGFGAKK